MSCLNCCKYTNCEYVGNGKPCYGFKPDNLPELNEWLDYNRLIIGKDNLF